jgi:ribonuclease VapC
VIVDSSAVVAILRQEEDAKIYSDAIELAVDPKMSVASYLEVALVLDRMRDPIIGRGLDAFMADSGIELVEVTPVHAQLAREAWRDFGRGSGHPAQLNFGDLFAYALANERNEPLLFKGGDFAHTDVKNALSSRH